MPIREFVSEYHKADRRQFTGHPGVISVDLDTFTIWIHDGVTPGGLPSSDTDVIPTLTASLINNTSIPTPFLSYPTSFSNGRINFAATKEGNTDFGLMSIFQDGHTAYFVMQGGNTGSPTGITFSVSLSSTVDVKYITTNGSGDGSITFELRTF